MLTKVFPMILMCLDVCAAICYGFDGQWRSVVYWGAAAVLTASVTF